MAATVICVFYIIVSVTVDVSGVTSLRNQLVTDEHDAQQASRCLLMPPTLLLERLYHLA